MKRSFILLIALLLCSQAFSQQPYSIDIRADNSISTRLYCGLQDTSGAPAQVPVQYIGDINGDGIQDFAIGGSNFNNVNGFITILYGGNSNALYTGFDYCTFTDISLGFRINGNDAEGFGYRIAAAGDLNGDGIPDLAVTAPRYNSNDGRIYFIYIPNNRPAVEYNVRDLTYYTVTPVSGTAKQLGIGNPSPAGDQNGDGVPDMIIGSSGLNQAFILFGQNAAAKGSDIIVTQLNAAQGVILSGSQGDTNFGAAVSMCGDITGDGKPELLITSSAKGFVYIWYGTNNSPSPVSQTIQSNMNGYIVNTGSAGLRSIPPVCVDINNDGALDLAVAANNALVYVIYGGSIFGITDMGNMQAYQGFYIRRFTPSLNFGYGLTTSSNHSGVAKNDLIIGDFNNNAAYMLYADQNTYGPHSGLNWIYVDFITPAQGYKMESKLSTDSVAYGISAKGDMNGDGIADVLMSSRGNNDVYVVRGFCLDGQRCIPRKLSGGQIAGIVVGVVAFAVIIAVVVLVYLKKSDKCCFGRNRAKSANGNTAGSGHLPLGQTANTPTIVHEN